MDTIVIVNYRYKEKYAKYISVYINIKIVEILKYDLGCMRYYIVIAICRFIIIFWTIK
jgi:hypothetical protein